MVPDELVRQYDETAVAWANRLLQNLRTHSELIQQVSQARHDELEWLRKSMTADGIPHHIQRLVIARWCAEGTA